MINRTYIAQLSESIVGVFDLDIVVGATMGTRLAPVGLAAAFPGATLTVPPAGWGNGATDTNAYYEVQGRTLRTEFLTGGAGFTPRTNLGFHLSVHAYNTNLALVGTPGTPNVIMSASLAATLGDGIAMVGAAFPDPAYGPVIRLRNDPILWAFLPFQSRSLWVVNFTIFDLEDEDANQE